MGTSRAWVSLSLIAAIFILCLVGERPNRRWWQTLAMWFWTFRNHQPTRIYDGADRISAIHGSGTHCARRQVRRAWWHWELHTNSHEGKWCVLVLYGWGGGKLIPVFSCSKDITIHYRSCLDNDLTPRYAMTIGSRSEFQPVCAQERKNMNCPHCMRTYGTSLSFAGLRFLQKGLQWRVSYSDYQT